jgi:hypothetical protein
LRDYDPASDFDLMPGRRIRTFIKPSIYKIVKIAELEELNLRFAPYLYQHNDSPRHRQVISEAPGHASVAFTMDVYSHIIKGMQEDAMKLLDDVLPSGKAGFRKDNANLTPTFNITNSVA